MRRAARESLYQLVFEYTFYGVPNERTLEILTSSSDLNDEDKAYIDSTYFGIIERAEEIREVISSHLSPDSDPSGVEAQERATINAVENAEGEEEKSEYFVIEKSSRDKQRRTRYTIDRISRPELTALYIAVYELLVRTASNAVIINEAVDLAKKYGAEKSGKFVNGVLANVVKDFEE